MLASSSEPPWYRRSDLQTSSKQRVAGGDAEMTRRRSALTVSATESSAELCHHCQANISSMNEMSLVRPARDLNMDGFFAQDYEDMVFCSPGCAVSMFHAKEEAHLACVMESMAFQHLSRLNRYEPGSYVRVPYGSRSGLVLGADPEDQRAIERDVVTKRRPVRS